MHYAFVKFILLFFFLNLKLFEQVSASDSLNFKKDSVAGIYLSAAKRYFSESKTAEALSELLKAETLYKKTGNKNGEKVVLIAFAKFYENNLLWDDARIYYQKAFLLADQKDSTDTSGDIAFSLAKTLYQQGKYEEALKFDTYSLNQFTAKEAKGKMAECYVHIAAIKKNQRDYAQAENLILHQALSLFRSADNQYGRISCFDVLGHIYHEQKRYSEAKWFFIQANTQSRKLKDTLGIVTSLINLGKVKIDIKDYDLAIRDFKEAEALSLEKRMLLQLADVKKAYSILYQRIGSKNVSGRYLADYQILRDSISRIQINRSISAIHAKNDAEKMVQIKQKRIIASGSNTALYFLSAIIVLIIIVSILLFFLRRKNKFRLFAL